MMYGLDGGSCKYCGPPPIQISASGRRQCGGPERKNALPSLLYMYHYIYVRSGKGKRSVRGPRETELTLRGKRRKPSPGGLAHAAQRAARAMRRPGDGSGENAGQGRAGFV